MGFLMARVPQLLVVINNILIQLLILIFHPAIRATRSKTHGSNNAAR
jgi:hypothetical protein